jgi:hypothetical protein
MPRKPHAEAWQLVPLSDEAAAYIADVLMQLAFDFEAAHLGQIHRHYQSITPEPLEDPRQLQLFPKHPSSPFDRQREF